MRAVAWSAAVLSLARGVSALSSGPRRPCRRRGVALEVSPKTLAQQMLYVDQQAAMARGAEAEGALLAARTAPLGAPDLAAAAAAAAAAALGAARAAPAGRKGARGFGAAKRGFGAAVAALGATAAAPSAWDATTSARAAVLAAEGVLLIPGAIDAALAADLRACVVDECEASRAACAAEPSEAMARFHSDIEQPLRSFLLLPFRDAPPPGETGAEADAGEPVMVRGLRALLDRGSALGDLFEALCGSDAVFYDFNALRTEPGSKRQPVHCDTPLQTTPPLFTAFVALQDVTIDMGPTMFIPRTHTRASRERAAFDAGAEAKDTMFADCESRFALLKAGDVSIFDMRLLHAGTPNSPALGSTRYFLNFTFRNLKAKNRVLGHEPCIRAGYKGRLSITDVRDQLAKPEPFSLDEFGDGLL
ncbi:hypothetical protein M885DRAFT_539754 [Pelagophyceae sp. CCMP2097]|nr:hypothetical protein M885DRAFT_539754 [Pelagophyceae sp. CCMP2097]